MGVGRYKEKDEDVELGSWICFINHLIRNVRIPVERKTRSNSLLNLENEGKVLRRSSVRLELPPSGPDLDVPPGTLDEEPFESSIDVEADDGREIKQVKRYIAISWPRTSSIKLELIPLEPRRLNTRWTQTKTALRLTKIIEPIRTKPTSLESLVISSSMLNVMSILATK